MSGTHITLDEFHQLHKNLKPKQVILDVRRPDEFAEGHIQGAMNIPVDEVATKFSELEKFDQVYIHCKRGGRAQTAFKVLTEMGLKNLVCVHDAGMDLWIERGYPVSRT